MDLYLKRATADDEPYFRDLNRACYEAVIALQFGHWDEELQNQSFEAKWPTNNFRKVLFDRQLIGGIWIDENVDFIQLREIQIHPTFQGRGIGTQLIMQELDYARQQHKPIRLRVLFRNPAKHLYERLGFSLIDRNEHQFIMEYQG
ncbi:MAG: GNAT superfamily N-acetyltransferase [Patiriisocius sp.]|jgi:GNAT superfamily N-acetyltransferase